MRIELRILGWSLLPKPVPIAPQESPQSPPRLVLTMEQNRGGPESAKLVLPGWALIAKLATQAR
ncbi:MAG: hypothetical protein HC919_13580 [Oscillatoriales cyanobacterium SM2_2_1]|nr:hypothetical protein [Oscillatoriales cyanobacterium SM2_2_1]